MGPGNETIVPVKVSLAPGPGNEATVPVKVEVFLDKVSSGLSVSRGARSTAEDPIRDLG